MAGRSARRARLRAVVTAALIAVLAGCGSAGPELLDGPARDTLHARVDDIRAALGDPRRAADAIEDFRAEVRRLRESEELAAADARVLLKQVAQIEDGLEAEPAASPAPAPVVVVEVPERDGDGTDAGKQAEEERKKADEERKKAGEEKKKADEGKKKGGGNG